jgi:hypothetical protein
MPDEHNAHDLDADLELGDEDSEGVKGGLAATKKPLPTPPPPLGPPRPTRHP